MEPVTHVLTGVCLARSGFNRKAAYATLTMAIAAELPDIDTVWSWRGPVEGFTHHRGITHTFVAVPVEAAVLVGVVWAWHRSAGIRGQGSGSRGQSPPLRRGWLYVCAVVGLLSHLLLDYTNNYGIRPFFPFNARWYAGSFVFIFDPLIFLLLVGALVAPWLFGLVGAEIGARQTRFRGRGWAIAALTGVVMLWGLRAVEHAKAVEMALGESVVAPVDSDKQIPFGNDSQKGNDEMQVPFGNDSQKGNDDKQIPFGNDSKKGKSDKQIPLGNDSQKGNDGTQIPFGNDKQMDAGVAPAEAAPVYLQAQRALASPDPLSPFRWSVVTDFGPVYQMAEVNTRAQTLAASDLLQPKPLATAAFVAAAKSPLGRAYLDWSPMPFVTQEASPDGTIVMLRDPRFLGGWLAEHGHTALTGSVKVDAQGRVVEQVLDGRVERSR